MGDQGVPSADNRSGDPARFGDKEALTLHMYTRFVDGIKQRKIIQDTGKKSKAIVK